MSTIAVTAALLWVCVITQQQTFTVLQQHLQNPAFSTKRNIFYQDNLRRTRRYIHSFWQQLDRGGCTIDVIQQSFEHEYDLEYDYEVPSGGHGVDNGSQLHYEGQNVILVVRGLRWGTKEDRPLLVGAHYDSYGNSPGT